MDKQSVGREKPVDKKEGEWPNNCYPQENPLSQAHFSPTLSAAHFSYKSSTCAVF